MRGQARKGRRPHREAAGRVRPGPELQPRLKVWVVLDGRVKFGDGRATLLERIEELGSLRKAVARFGMSYRAAWGYFRELERAAGFAFLERRPGGHAGMRLTADARRFVRRYRSLQRGLDRALARHFERAFLGRR